MKIKGSLQLSIFIVKAFLSRNFQKVPSKIGLKLPFCGGKWGRKNFVCETPKSTSLREKTSFDVLTVKIGAGVLAVV